MIVVVLSKCPPKLRGDLSKWLMEINTGVYVGKLSSRVRDELWKRICDNIGDGRASMVFSTNNEQGLDFYVHNTTWKPVDFEGIKLIRKPSLEQSHNAKVEYNSKASLYNAVRRRTVSEAKKKLQNGYIVLDVETTGLNSEIDEIIEIGAIHVAGGSVADELSMLVKIDRPIPEKITKFTGISDWNLMNSGTELRDAVNKLIEFIGDRRIVGYNISFDMAFINEACRKIGIRRIENTCTDVLELARRSIDDIKDYKMRTVAEYFGFDASQQHRALSDCRTTYEIYQKLNEI